MYALIFDSPMDLLVVGLVVLILFGGKKIPEMMRGLGSGVREFREGMRVPEEQPHPPASPAAPSQPTQEKK